MFVLIEQDEVVPRKEKRQYKKRKHKTGSGVGAHGHGHLHGRVPAGSDLLGYNCAPGGELLSSEDEGDVALSAQSPQSDDEEPDPNEGMFTFRRKKYCNYHAVSMNIVKFLYDKHNNVLYSEEKYIYL